MTLVDLTHPLTPDAHVPAGLGEVRQRLLSTHADGGLQDTALELPMHAGTHLDAPLHALPGGQDVASIPLDRLIAPAVAWSIPCTEAREIHASELAAAEPPLERGSGVIIATGWEHFYDRVEVYREHPHLGEDAALWLLEHGATLLGLDTPTPDLRTGSRPPGFTYPVHRTLLGGGVLIVENLANLSRVVGRSFRLLLSPLPVVRSDGAPVRAIAELDV